jgi:hypothetical protein
MMWHIDPLLGNDHETNNGTTAIDRQQLRKYIIVFEPFLGSDSRAITKVMLEAVFSMSPLRGYTTRPTEYQVVSAVRWSGASWLISDIVQRESPAAKDVNTEAEKATALEAVNRGQPVSIQ